MAKRQPWAIKDLYSSLPATAGTYFKAAALGEKFNVHWNGTGESSSVKDVFGAAVDFMAEITPDILKGKSLISSKPRSVIGAENKIIFDEKKIQEIAYESLPGDALKVETPILMTGETERKLEKLVEDYKLKDRLGVPAKISAAKLAIAVYASFQKAAAPQYNKVFIAKVKNDQISDSPAHRNLKSYSLKA